MSLYEEVGGFDRLLVFGGPALYTAGFGDERSMMRVRTPSTLRRVPEQRRSA